MPKYLIRIVALFLVPCLIGDPVVASAVAYPRFPPAKQLLPMVFKEQAVVPALVASSRDPLDELAKPKKAGINRAEKELLPSRRKFMGSMARALAIFVGSTAISPTLLLAEDKAEEDTLRKVSPFIIKYALQYNLNPLLVRAIIHAESNFILVAHSQQSAWGLMQITLSTARGLLKQIPELAAQFSTANPTDEELKKAL